MENLHLKICLLNFKLQRLFKVVFYIYTSLSTFININQMSPQSSFPQAELTQVTKSFHIRELLQVL